MFWNGLLIGMAVGFALACILAGILERITAYMKIEREIIADIRKIAEEEHTTSALRLIAQNEQQANKGD